MADDQKNPGDMAPALTEDLQKDHEEAMKAMGYSDTEPKKEDPQGDTTPDGADGEVKGEGEGVDTPEPVADPEPEAPENKADPEPQSESPDGDEPDEDSHTVPYGLYKDTKKKLKARIAELESKLSQDGDEPTGKEGEDIKKIINDNPDELKQEARLKAYAEKHGLDPESVGELADIFRDVLIEADPTYRKVKDQVAKEEFNEEFSEVLPKIKETFPNATEEQIKVAKAKLEEMGHSKWGHDKELDYIFWNKKDEFASIFKDKNPENKVKTMENGRLGPGGPKTFTAKDFDEGKATMQDLASLPFDQREGIVKNMNPFTQEKWGRYLQSHAGNEIKVMRNGQKVSLKT